ncbi:MAG: SRPBCC family protein [Ferruginibacter sp.]
MENNQFVKVTVETTVDASIDKVWESWTDPKHITQWCHASEDWHAPYADNDPVTGGKFKTTMAAKDGSFGFDFEGIYSLVIPKELIQYELEDGRKVSIDFTADGGKTRVIEKFDAETMNPVEMQREGWQAILDNFKKYTESL